MTEEKRRELTMIVFSGDMDKLMAAFLIATGAAASDMDVTMFFTFYGLLACIQVYTQVNSQFSLLSKRRNIFCTHHFFEHPSAHSAHTVLAW